MHSPSLRLSPAPDQNFSPPPPPHLVRSLLLFLLFLPPLLHSHGGVAAIVRASMCLTKPPPPTEAPINSSVVARIFWGRLNHPDDAKLLSRLLKPAFRGLEKAFLPSLSLSPRAPAIHIQPTPLPPSLLPPPQLLLPSSHPPCHGVSWLISQ